VRIPCSIGFRAVPLLVALALLTSLGADEVKEKDKLKEPGKTPTQLPKIPAPDVKAVQVPDGFSAQLVTADLVYPTGITFDDKGTLYIAEAGFSYGDPVAAARVTRRVPIAPSGYRIEVVADQLNGPVTDILWHQGRLYISHRGKVSVVEQGKLRDLVTGLPSLGDHHNNQLAVGPDGKIYFGQGTATNAGVVGVDNFLFGWLQKFPDVHDVPGRDITLRPRTFETPNPIALLTDKGDKKVRTMAFQAFGKAKEHGAGAEDEAVKVKGQVKANGTILRMNADGSALEVYAWGLRNPFGVRWGPDNKLYVTDAGYDERGSRPIANAPDCLWVIKQGAWYGFPDFVGGVPVTDGRFKSARGPAPEFLLKDHPEVEKPMLTLPPHTGGAGFDFSRSPLFGSGMVYVALMGDMTPATGEPNKHPGPGVVRLDPKTLKMEPFFGTRTTALGPKGLEYVATAGLKRPVNVRFSPQGDALYVVDFGAETVVPSAVGPVPQPFPGTGAIWRIVPVRKLGP